MDLEMVFFGEFTLRQCLYAAGEIIAVMFVVNFVKKRLFPPKADLRHSVAFACPDCGWTGHIGKYARSCPKCSRLVD